MQWLADVDGDLVNLMHVIKVNLIKVKVGNDRWQVIATDINREKIVIQDGDVEDCLNFMRDLKGVEKIK